MHPPTIKRSVTIEMFILSEGSYFDGRQIIASRSKSSLLPHSVYFNGYMNYFFVTHLSTISFINIENTVSSHITQKYLIYRVVITNPALIVIPHLPSK